MSGPKKGARKAGREKQKEPNNNLLKITYHEKRKEYEVKCNSKIYSFWQNTIREVEVFRRSKYFLKEMEKYR